MRLLTDADRETLMRYLQTDEAYNLFIIGDVENFGLQGELASVAVHEIDNRWDSVTLRFGKYFVVYAQQLAYDAASVASYIKKHAYKGINGKGSVIEKLIPYFQDMTPRMTILARCDAIQKPKDDRNPKAVIRRVDPSNARDIVSLYCQIKQFRDQYIGQEAEQTALLEQNLTCGGIGIGAFVDARPVSYAQTTAQNSRSAMITGVCTLPAFEKQGLATHVLMALCQNVFESGLKFLCLFYDNPQAGRIYERIGFHRVGDYLMLIPKKANDDQPIGFE